MIDGWLTKRTVQQQSFRIEITLLNARTKNLTPAPLFECATHELRGNTLLGMFLRIKGAQKKNLISLSDQMFPGVNWLFTSVARDSDGHEKWIDFLRHRNQKSK